MFKGLIRRVIAASVVAASAFVAVAALGAAVYALLVLALPPAAAAAITAVLFALIAVLTAVLFLGDARGEDDEDAYDEPEGLAGRLIQIVRQRPVLGAVGGLAAALLMLRNPALAAIAASLITERRMERRDRRR